MLRKVIFTVFPILIWIAHPGCNTLKITEGEYFKIKSAFYQPWIVSGDEKGTDVIVELAGVNKAVTFDSIVFRGVRMKAFAERRANSVELKSILPAGISRIKDLNVKVTGFPDQVIYHYREKRMTSPLKIRERKPDKVY